MIDRCTGLCRVRESLYHTDMIQVNDFFQGRRIYASAAWWKITLRRDIEWRYLFLSCRIMHNLGRVVGVVSRAGEEGNGDGRFGNAESFGYMLTVGGHLSFIIIV